MWVLQRHELSSGLQLAKWFRNVTPFAGNRGRIQTGSGMKEGSGPCISSPENSSWLPVVKLELFLGDSCWPEPWGLHKYGILFHPSVLGVVERALCWQAGTRVLILSLPLYELGQIPSSLCLSFPFCKRMELDYMTSKFPFDVGIWCLWLLIAGELDPVIRELENIVALTP